MPHSIAEVENELKRRGYRTPGEIREAPQPGIVPVDREPEPVIGGGMRGRIYQGGITYGRPAMREQREEPGYASVIGKGLMRGLMGLGAGVGAAARWAGEITGGRALGDMGATASQYWNKAIREGRFKPDEEVFAGSFLENPSLKRATGIVAEAIPSLGAAIVASIVTGNPAAGAAMLGLLEGAPQYEEARQTGKSVGEASVYGGLSTVGTALLEYLPIGRMFKRGKEAAKAAATTAGKAAAKGTLLQRAKGAITKPGALSATLKGGVEEAGQEASQQLYQNLIARIGYDETRSITEGVIESIIGGAGSGGIAGGTIAKLEQAKERARKRGATDQEINILTGKVSRETQDFIVAQAANSVKTFLNSGKDDQGNPFTRETARDIAKRYRKGGMDELANAIDGIADQYEAMRAEKKAKPFTSALEETARKEAAHAGRLLETEKLPDQGRGLDLEGGQEQGGPNLELTAPGKPGIPGNAPQKGRSKGASKARQGKVAPEVEDVPTFEEGEKPAKLTVKDRIGLVDKLGAETETRFGKVKDLSDQDLLILSKETAPEPTGPPPKAEIDAAAHEAATSPNNALPEPTKAQIEKGNYKKGHISLHGLDISIENPAGSTRKGVSPEGKKWETLMHDHYGYIRGYTGKDKDHVDVFIGRKPESQAVFVVNQVDPKTGRLDEHKIMLGYGSEAEAKKAYLRNYEKGWKGLGSTTPMSLNQFKEWLEKGDKKKPAEQQIVAGLTADEEPGDGGVRRITYKENGRKIGTARLMGNTIGGIEVVPTKRRQGYGLKIVNDLVQKGGTATIPINEESKRLFSKAGFEKDEGGWYRIAQHKAPAEEKAVVRPSGATATPPPEMTKAARAYFKVTEDERVRHVPIASLTLFEQPKPESVRHARDLMRRAEKGEIEPRGPLAVVQRGDEYIVADGNATVKALREMGKTSETIPAHIIDSKYIYDDDIREARKIVDRVSAQYQPVLDRIGEKAAALVGGRRKGTAKSIKSILQKVSRKREAGAADYAVHTLKDHAKGTVFVGSFADAPKVIEHLKNQGFEVEITIDTPLNQFGYRGINLTVRLGDGIGGEIQIHTKESWALKEWSDKIYGKWRDYPKSKREDLSLEETKQYLADKKASYDAWANFWGNIPAETKEALSALDSGRESQAADMVTPTAGTQEPKASSKTLAPSSSSQNSLPSSSLETGIKSDILESPPKNITPEIAQNVKKKPEQNVPSDEREMASYDEVRQWERSHYVDERGWQTGSSRTKPMSEYPWKAGTWKIDNRHYGPYGRDVEQLREVPVDDLVLSEADYTKVNDEGRGEDAARYAVWAREGKNIPPISVIETDTGKLMVSDGHRRLAAAKLAGKKTILAWVSPRMDTGKKTPEGNPIYVGATYEGLKHGAEAAAAEYNRRQRALLEEQKKTTQGSKEEAPKQLEKAFEKAALELKTTPTKKEEQRLAKVEEGARKETERLKYPAVTLHGDDYIDREGNIRIGDKKDEKALVDAPFEGKEKEQGGRVVLTGGPAGIGKSAMTSTYDKTRFVIADADKTKERAGYEGQAQRFHEESSRINDLITDKALQEGYPLIYDSQLTNYSKAESIIERALKRGSPVDVVFVHGTAQTSFSRAKARQELGLTAREVTPEASIKGFNYGIPTFLALLEKYKNNPRVNFKLSDNDVDGLIGGKKVMERIDGETTIFDQELFEEITGIEYNKVENGRTKYVRKDQYRLEDYEREKAVIDKRVFRIVRQGIERGDYPSPGKTNPQALRAIPRQRDQEVAPRPEGQAPTTPPQNEIIEPQKQGLHSEEAQTSTEKAGEIGETEGVVAFDRERYEPYLKEISEQVEAGEPGRRMQIEVAPGRYEWTGIKSSYPAWMRDKGWTKKGVLRAISKGIAGEKLGKKQREIFEAALAEAQKMRYDELSEAVRYYDANPQDLIDLAEEQYNDFIKELEDEGIDRSSVEEIGRARDEAHTREAISRHDQEEGEDETRASIDELGDWFEDQARENEEGYIEEPEEDDREEVKEQKAEYRAVPVSAAGRGPALSEGRISSQLQHSTPEKQQPKQLAEARITFSEVVAQPTGAYKTGLVTIKNAADAAHIGVLNLSEEPQEHVIALFTDKDGKLLSVYRHTIGTEASSQVSAKIIAGRALNTEGTKNVWVVHNHPSGTPSLSGDDIALGGALRNIFRSTRISFQDLIAITPNGEYAALEHAGTASRIPTSNTVMVVERKFVRHTQQSGITSPEELDAFMKRHIPNGGVVLLDNANRPVGTLSLYNYQRLRGTQQELLLSEIEKRNAQQFAVHVPERKIGETPSRSIDDPDLKNLMGFSKGIDAYLVDVIDSDGSVRKRIGDDWWNQILQQSSGAFFSRNKAESSGITVPDLENSIGKFLSFLPGAPIAEFYQDLDAVPYDEVLAEARRGGGIVAAFFYKGRIHLVAENIPTVERAFVDMWHELSHFGCRKLFGDKYDRFLHQVFTSYGKAKLQELADLYGFDLSTREGQLKTADEKVARIIEKNENPGLIRQLIALIRNLLRKPLSALGINLRITDNDILCLVAPRVRDYLMSTKPETLSVLRDKLEPLLSRRQDLPEDQQVSVVVADANAFTGSLAEKRRNALKFALANLRASFLNDYTGWNIQVARKGIEKAVSKRTAQEHFDTIKALPELLKNAILAESHSDREGNPDIRQVHRFYAPLALGEKLYRVKLTVKETKEGRKFYDHSLTEIEMPEALRASRVQEEQWDLATAPGTLKKPATIISIADLLQGATKNDGAKFDFRKEAAFSRRPEEPAPNLYEYSSQAERIARKLLKLDPQKLDTEKTQLEEEFPRSIREAGNRLMEMWKRRKLGWKIEKPDTTVAERLLASPEFYFEKVQAAQRVFNAALEKNDNAHHLINQMLETKGGKGLVGSLELLKKENPFEYERLKNLIAHADRNKITLTADQVKAKKFSDLAVAAWQDYRKIMDNGFDNLMAELKNLIARYEEAGLELPEVAVIVDGERVEVNLKKALAMMGDMRGYYAPRRRRPGRFMLKARKEGTNPILELFDSETFLTNRQVQLEAQGYKVEKTIAGKMPEDVFQIAGQTIGTQAMINQALEHMQQKAPPKTLADFGLTGTWGRTSDKQKELVITGPASKKYTKIFKALGGKWYKAGDGPKAWRFVGASKWTEKKIIRALGGMDEALVNTELMFAHGLAIEVANIIKGRGFRSSMIQRGEATGKDVWIGYEEDPIRAAVQYVSGVAHGLAKKTMAEKMVRAVTGTDIDWRDCDNYEQYLEEVKARRIDPQKQPNIFHDVKVFMEDMLRNEELADRIIGMIKGVAVVKYLGGRVSAPLANLTAMVTSVPAAMNGYAGIPIHSTYHLLGDAAKMYGTYRFGDRSQLSPSIVDLLDEIHDKGWHEAQYNQEALSVLQTKIGRGWDKAVQWSMLGFGATEQLNRVSTILATYIGIKQRTPARRFNHQEALQLAKKVSDRAHGVYGKVSYPYLARGSNLAAQIGRCFMVFKKFSHTYLQTMYDLGFTHKNRKALLYMMVSPAVIAGAGASVVWPVLMGALRMLLDADDPEEDIYNWLEQNFGAGASNFVRYGVPGIPEHGISLKGSLQIGITDLPTSLADILGAPGSLMGDIWYGGENILKGNVSKGLERLLPRALGAPLQALREATEGVTTKSNAPVFYGTEQIRANTMDAICRALSFNPTQIAKKRDILWSDRQVAEKYAAMRTDIYAKVKKFYLRPVEERSKADWIDIAGEIKAYNDRVQKNGLSGIVPFIGRQSLKTAIRSTGRPPKAQIMKQRTWMRPLQHGAYPQQYGVYPQYRQSAQVPGPRGGLTIGGGPAQ